MTDNDKDKKKTDIEKQKAQADGQDELYALTGQEDKNRPNEMDALTGNYADGGVVADDKKDKEPYTGVMKEPSKVLSPADQVINHLLNKNTGISITEPNPVDPAHAAKGLFMQKRFADGGVATPNANEPMAPEGPSEDEKRELVMKALRENPHKFDEGGIVDPAQLPMDAPQPSKIQAVLNALGMVSSSPAAKVAGAVMNPVSAIADAVTSSPVKNLVGQEVKAASPVMDTMAGVPPPAPTSAPSLPPVENTAAPVVNTPQKASAPAPSAPDPLSQLGKFDPSAVTAGFNPADRQNLANNLNTNQHTFGNYLAEAVAGLGDAVAAKGGVRQNALGDIFALQTQQRNEALENFDKARQAAVEHFTMKNQADQALINNLKARGELQVSPGIAAAIGHPELANRPVAQAELIIKTDAMKYDFANKMQERKQSALKNAADDVDKALTHGGMFGTQKMMDAKSRLNMIHAQAIKNDPEAFGYSVTKGK